MFIKHIHNLVKLNSLSKDVLILVYYLYYPLNPLQIMRGEGTKSSVEYDFREYL